ncbi:MAG: plasmid segregation protein ParM domain-containing protein, partial [Arsenophonus sp. NC-PY1-MAG3]
MTSVNNASETTTINYQYSDENLLSVHHALLNTDLT